MKKCTKCKQEKPKTEFSKNKNNKDELNNRCKECYKKHHKENYIRKTEDLSPPKDSTNKICINCKKEKPKTKFSKDKSRKDGLANWCKECVKIYHETNKEHLKEYHKEHNSKPEVKERERKWSKNRYETDPEFKMIKTIRCRINRATNMDLLNSSFKHKSNKKIEEEYLGCSIPFYIKFLESKFYPEMTWENWGEVWEIDHIIPIASFKGELIEKQKETFHYTNTQPLFKTTEIAESFGYKGLIGNRNKNARILEEDLVI